MPFFFDFKKANDYFQRWKACSLYTQLLGLEEAMEKSTVVLVMRGGGLENCKRPSEEAKSSDGPR